jgi:hypothetical protein
MIQTGFDKATSCSRRRESALIVGRRQSARTPVRGYKRVEYAGEQSRLNGTLDPSL